MGGATILCPRVIPMSFSVTVLLGGGLPISVTGECMYEQSTSYTDLSCIMTFTFGSGKLVIEAVLNSMVIVDGIVCFFGASGTIASLGVL